jgi:proteasome lid subunit RPN8/RPN11
MDDRDCKRRIDLQKIILSKLQKKILLDHSHKEEPNESCAILYGDKNNETYTVKEIWLTENIASSPKEFTLSPEQNKEMHDKEKIDLEIIGIFHSHPKGDAYPSNTDKKFMENNLYSSKIKKIPEWVWVIYSGINEDFKAYVLESDILEIPIKDLSTL